MLIISNLSWKKNFILILKEGNRALFLVLGGAILSLFLIFLTPFLRDIFHFSPLTVNDMFIVLVSGIGIILWFELLKLFNKDKQTVNQKLI
jgi:Ca2+-transporting ATPase